MFEQPTYNVTENAGPARPVLVLSNPSSMEFNVIVFNTDGSAMGEYCSVCRHSRFRGIQLSMLQNERQEISCQNTSMRFVSLLFVSLVYSSNTYHGAVSYILLV